MRISILISEFFHSQIPRLAIVTLIALVWSAPSFCREIHDAARAGDMAKVKALLKENPYLILSKDNIGGGTPLHMAASSGHKDVVELLLANKADVNAKSYYNGGTPLHWAVSSGHKGVVELLLANKADVNAKANGSMTYFPLAFQNAVKAGDMAKIQALQKGNPDLIPSMDNKSITPLHVAAGGGHKDVVELLLANKADVNAKTNNGGTPLHWAVSRGHKGVVELLLANKADVNDKDNNGVTLLLLAAQNGHKDVVTLLLSNKADVNVKDNNGGTPLLLAAQNGHKDVVKLLLANKADVNAKSNNGGTPLHWATLRGSKDVVKLLLANKADVNAKDNNGYTPLLLAARASHKDVVELLRQHGGSDQAVAAPSRSEVLLGNNLLEKQPFIANDNLGRIRSITKGKTDSAKNLIIVGESGALTVEQNGKQGALIFFDRRVGETVPVQAIAHEPLKFMNRGGGWQPVSLLDSNGRTLWMYPLEKQDAADSMAAGDLNKDGKLEFVVGMNGSGGLHILDANGKELWEKPAGNVFSVEVLDKGPNGAPEILHSDSEKGIVVRNAEGEEIRTIKNCSSGSFSLLGQSAVGASPLIVCVNGGLKLVDLKDNVVKSFKLPGGGYFPQGAVVYFNGPNNPPYYAFVSQASGRISYLLIYDGDGALIFHEKFEISYLAISSLTEKGKGLDALLVGENSKVWLYRMRIHNLDKEAKVVR